MAGSQRKTLMLADSILHPKAPEKTVIDVTFIKATDLRKSDSHGKSDPYCTIEIEGEWKEVCRTQVIQKSLNPEWNHVCRIETMPPAGKNLVLKAWDYDSISYSDFLGDAIVASSVYSPGSSDIIELPLNDPQHTGGKPMLYIKVATISVQDVAADTTTNKLVSSTDRRRTVHVLGGGSPKSDDSPTACPSSPSSPTSRARASVSAGMMSTVSSMGMRPDSPSKLQLAPPLCLDPYPPKFADTLLISYSSRIRGPESELPNPLECQQTAMSGLMSSRPGSRTSSVGGKSGKPKEMPRDTFVQHKATGHSLVHVTVDDRRPRLLRTQSQDDGVINTQGAPSPRTRKRIGLGAIGQSPLLHDAAPYWAPPDRPVVDGPSKGKPNFPHWRDQDPDAESPYAEVQFAVFGDSLLEPNFKNLARPRSTAQEAKLMATDVLQWRVASNRIDLLEPAIAGATAANVNTALLEKANRELINWKAVQAWDVGYEAREELVPGSGPPRSHSLGNILRGCAVQHEEHPVDIHPPKGGPPSRWPRGGEDDTDGTRVSDHKHLVGRTTGAQSFSNALRKVWSFNRNDAVVCMNRDIAFPKSPATKSRDKTLLLPKEKAPTLPMHNEKKSSRRNH